MSRLKSARAARFLPVLVPALLLGGCVQQPMGPTIPVMPAPNKPFDVFQSDQVTCENFASGQVAGGAQAANTQQVLTGVAATVIGAGLGAAIGGGRGAAIGAASGATYGTIAGFGPSQMSQMSLQQRYDMFYAQCMYGHGNQVPGFAPSYAPPPPPPPRP